jgi:hypothetical protein
MRFIEMLISLVELVILSALLVIIIVGVTIAATAGGGPLFGVGIFLLLLGNAWMWGKHQRMR